MTYDQYRDSDDFGNPYINELTLQVADAEIAFKQFNAQAWIDHFRVETDGKLDIEVTAAKVGVPVLYEMPLGKDGDPIFAQGCVEGLMGDKPVTIHLNPSWGKDDHLVTFGHELGHIFIETTAGIVVKHRRPEVERFCDFFGTQMALPVEKLIEQETFNAHEVAALSEKYGVRYTTVLHQLMLAGKLPRRIIIDTGIGEAKNSFYSNKVRRHIICLDCEIENPHSTEIDQATTPHYDFTAFDWSNITSITDCDGHKSSRIDDHVSLNKAYGRWTDVDEAMIPAERERNREMDQLISRWLTKDQEPVFEQNELF
jgi:Zn-dependent peptidase ImmA (M78 family)